MSKLRNLKLTRVDRVTDPANPGAQMLLAKAQFPVVAQVDAIINELVYDGLSRPQAMMKALEMRPELAGAYHAERAQMDALVAKADEPVTPAEPARKGAGERIAELAKDLGVSIQQAAEQFAKQLQSELEAKTETEPSRTAGGQLLRDARIDRGMSMVALAKAANVSRTTVYNVEMGFTQPEALTLHAMFNALGLDPAVRAAIKKAL